MDRHAHARLLGNRHDALEEIREMIPQALSFHVAICSEQDSQLV